MVKNIFRISSLVLVLIGCEPKIEQASKNTQEKSLTVGTNHIIKSKVLNEDRPIIISVPENYDKSKASYPVLYLTDGLQNIWHVIGTVEVLTRTGSIPPMIIVGIESTDRVRDFSPTPSKNNPSSGNGPKYLEFIETELIPYVESTYRTHPFRVLEGHSLGGLFASYVLMTKPTLFNAHIIMSPSFWWNKEESKTKMEAFLKTNQDLEVAMFFGIGAYESSPKRGMRKELTDFIEVIKNNQPKKLRFEHQEMAKEGHMSSPLLSNYYGLKSIFSDLVLTGEIYDNYTDTAFLNHENGIMAKYGVNAKQSAEEYAWLAFQLINKKKYSEAITVLKRGSEAYSYDIFFYKLLAETHEKNKDIKNAIKSYQDAVSVSKKYKFGREGQFQKEIERLNKR